MARKRSRRSSSRRPHSYSDYRRLSPDENERAGFSRKARRYVLKSVRRLTKRTSTISARAQETLRTQQEYGFAKPELATEARKAGRLQHQQPTAAKHAKHARSISQWAPEMAPKDRAVAFKWFDVHDAGVHPAKAVLSTEDQTAFNQLFRRYEADAMRQLFGSEPRNLGSFPVAA